MKVEFNGSSMRAEMDGMGTPVSAPKDLTLLNKFRNGTIWSVGAVILALAALVFHLIGVGVRSNYVELLPEFLLEIYKEAGLYDLIPKYISMLFGFGGLTLVMLSIASSIASVVMFVQTKETATSTSKAVGIACVSGAVVLSIVVAVLSVMFI